MTLEHRPNMAIHPSERFKDYGKVAASNGSKLVGRSKLPANSGKAGAQSMAKAEKLDHAAIEAAGYAKGFRAATARAAAIMVNPIVAGHETKAAAALGNPATMNMSAEGFLYSFGIALAAEKKRTDQTIRKGWADAHAQIRQERAA